MSAIQLVTALFAAVMMYQTFLHFKRHDLQLGGLVFWESLWAGLMLIALLPQAFQRVISVAHVARLLDLVTILGLLILAAVTFQLYVVTRRLQRNLQQLVRSLALSGEPPPREWTATRPPPP